MVAVLQEVALNHGAVEEEERKDASEAADGRLGGEGGRRKSSKRQRVRNTRKTMTAELGGKLLSRGTFDAAKLPLYLGSRRCGDAPLFLSSSLPLFLSSSLPLSLSSSLSDFHQTKTHRQPIKTNNE